MEELLTCSVCCERYCEIERQPVVLPRCGHSFCRPCVTLLLSSNCIICPTCRTDQRIESAHRLPTEFTLLAIITAQENAKLDNCTRHDVKLSFWCKTCNLATCGECLFEDHPTHSHDVIRSLTYIKNIKESVHEIGCKFMEALDTREQTYYTTVYNCARWIDESLRNVSVLRKDMGEARSLMNGVKVDEANMTLSTATSLAEAAKFLGLKWNIQDANFNRSKQEAQEKEESKAVKVKEEEEEKKELTPEEEKERRKERIRERKRKRLLAEKEAKEAKEAKEEKDKKPKKPLPEEKKEVIPEPAPTTTVDAETVLKDDKKKVSSLRKSKTLSVFEPFSMDKEINGIKKNLVVMDNKERERIELEALKKIEDEEEQVSDKKYLEEKAIEAEKEAEAAVAAVKAAVAIKEAELKKILEKEELESNLEAEEKAAFRKAANEEMDRLNHILKKPQGLLAKRFLEETQDAAKLLAESQSAAASTIEPIAEETENTEEKTSGTPERSDKDENNGDPKPEQGAEGNPYAGELSLEEKEAKEKAEAQQKEGEGSKLFDFMKEPLFTVCIEGAEGRLALAQWEPKGIHVYCHQFQQLHYDIVIKSNVLEALIPSKNPIVFIEITVGTDRACRIYIKLWGHLRRAHNFMRLCLGDQGPALLNTKLLQVYNLNEGGERILGGDHEYNSGRGGCALLRDLEWNGDFSMPMQEGLLTAAGSGQHATNSLFLICTRGDPTRNFSCPFGEVVEGLEDVRDAIAKSEAEKEEIWITECGVLLEPPRVLA